ncbi:MAG: VPLPA-CTERM sorting domain-containing protein [Methylococcales bacterium]|nr:VPLPA-CTERM sorting domain-containing protein [Methylococcales bacterium]
MKYLLKAAVLMAAFTHGAAHADQFDFSYLFSSGDILTGNLIGTLDGTGTYITNISDVQIAFDGTQFLPDSTTGYLDIVAWNATTSTYDNSIAPVFSTNVALNNFAVADVDMAVNMNTSNYFSFINDPSYGQVAIAVNNNVLDANSNAQTAIDSPASGTWTITAVPVPSSLPLMLSGLGVFAAARRRIKA